MKHGILAACVAAAFAVPATAFATDGYFSHGYGMKAKGRGGASVAMIGDAFGGANNPATMAYAGDRFEIGLDLFSPSRSSERTGGVPIGLTGSVDSDSDYFFVPEVAFNKMLREDLALGVTVYGNGGLNTNYPGGQLPSPGACGPATGPGTGFNPRPGPYNLLCGNGRLGVDLSQLIIAPTLAWKFNPNHSIGLSPLFAYQRFQAEGLGAFGAFSNDPANFSNRGYDDSTGWGARVGYYGALTPRIAVGATYATKISMGELDKYRGLFAEQGGFDIPSNWAVGVAFKPIDKWTVAADFMRIDYSGVKSVSNPSANLGGCLMGNASQCLGGSDGAGFGWRSINVVKLGVEHTPTLNWTVRAGYNYSQNPIRSEDVTINILAPGVIKHRMTLGATYQWQKHEVTGAFMYAFKNDVTGPSLLNGFLPPGTPGFNEKIEMYEWSLGVQYAYKF
jgi:long-chain fatty acid transport protein